MSLFDPQPFSLKLLLYRLLILETWFLLDILPALKFIRHSETTYCTLEKTVCPGIAGVNSVSVTNT
jgi:hypothetical protein